MTKIQTQITQVAYNAGSQCFEALVTVGTGDKATKYPCMIEAPITMSFERAAEGLVKQALRNHEKRAGLQSTTRRHIANVRAGRPRFDPRTWLSQLSIRSFINAA